MNPRTWFSEMNGVKSTGSLNRCDTDQKEIGQSRSYMSDGGNLSFNSPNFVTLSERYIRDLNKKKPI